MTRLRRLLTIGICIVILIVACGRSPNSDPSDPSNLTTQIYSQPESTTARLLKEIGFEIVQPEGAKGDREISQEILSQIETDLIIVLSYSDDSFDNWEDTVRQKWTQNPLLNSMPVSQ